MVRTSRIFFLAVIILVAIAASPKSLGTAVSTAGTSRIDVTELKRVSGNMVSLKFTLSNEGNKAIPFGFDFIVMGSPTDNIRDSDTIAGTYLQDGTTTYHVARDEKGQCMCSSRLAPVAPKKRLLLWAKFLGPPDTVTKLTVMVPNFQPVEDVPLQPLTP